MKTELTPTGVGNYAPAQRARLRLAPPPNSTPAALGPFAEAAREAHIRTMLATAADLARIAALGVGRAASLFATASGSPRDRLVPTDEGIAALRQARELINEILGEVTK